MGGVIRFREYTPGSSTQPGGHMEKKYRVPRTAITERGLKKLLKDAVKQGKHTSPTAWAVAMGITPQQVSAFMTKVQGPGLKIPELLGYRPQVVYLPVDEDPITVALPPRRVATKRPTSKVDHSKDPVLKKGFVRENDREETKRQLAKRKRA